MDQNSSIRKLFFTIATGILLLALSLNSCRKDDELRWDSDLLVPIMHSSLDVWDIFGDTNVVENADQSMKLLIEETIDMLDPDKVIQVHDTLSAELFNIPLYLEYFPGDQLIKKVNSVAMDLGDMELTLARARVATMKFYVTNTIQRRLRVKYEMLSSEKDGKHFEIIEDVDAATASGPSYSVKTIHLDGYDINMTGIDGMQVNTVVSQTTVWLHPDADSIWITPDDTVLIISTFDELKVEYARGYFGEQNYLGSGSSFMDVFGNFKSGSFDLDHVNAQLKISNYTGMDVRMSLDKLSSYNNENHQEVMLNDPLIGSPLNIRRAIEKGPTLDDVLPSIEFYQMNQSNLDELIENRPDSLRFDLSALINPLGNVSSGNDFMYFEKGILASIGLEIPLNFSADNLRIEDFSTMNFDDDGRLKSGKLIAYVDNMFPFDLDIQFYILNEKREIVDSLFTEKNHIPSGVIDANGFVKMPSKNVLTIPLSQEKIELLRKYSDMLIRAEMNSAGNKTYQLYQNYNLDIRIVGDVKYEL
ncbi:MAG: hypothetical protein DRI84_05505 [Bacteroidetes bacterium]|nr:MAG: hypothetical protein DRI84_05505 [Bacteroidota bacterium]